MVVSWLPFDVNVQAGGCNGSWPMFLASFLPINVLHDKTFPCATEREGREGKREKVFGEMQRWLRVGSLWSGLQLHLLFGCELHTLGWWDLNGASNKIREETNVV